MAKKPTKAKIGRPKKVIDWDGVAEMGKRGCPLREVAVFLNLSETTLQERCKKENGKTIGEFLAENFDHTRMAVRKVLLDKVLVEQDAATIRYVGDRWLGYGQKVEISGEVRFSEEQRTRELESLKDKPEYKEALRKLALLEAEAEEDG